MQTNPNLEEQFNDFMNHLDYKGGIKAFKNLKNKEEKGIIYLATLYDHLAVQSKFRKYYEIRAKHLYLKAYKNGQKLDALLGLGRICWHRNEKKAIHYYRKALKISPNNARVYLALANIYKALGENKKAIRFYEDAIRFGSNEHFGAWLNLSLLWAKRGNKKKQEYT